MIDWGLLAALGVVNATIPLSIFWWRRVAWDDPYFMRGIPARSALPMMLSLPLAIDVLAVGSRLVSTDAGATACLAVFAIAGIVTASTWIARVPRWAIPPKIREPKDHDAAVYYVSASDGAEEPYFVGICSCGWSGGTVSDRGDAEREARTHHPIANIELRRPGGEPLE